MRGLIKSPVLLIKMIKKIEIEDIVNFILTDQKDEFEDQDIFYVNTKVSSDNRISVFIDSMNSIHINDCVKLSKLIEARLDREKEDFELIVSSAGLDQAFTVIKQYEKNIGKQIKVKTTDGRNIKGKLTTVNENGIALVLNEKKAKNKKEQIQQVETEVKFQDITEAKVVITF